MIFRNFKILAITSAFVLSPSLLQADWSLRAESESTSDDVDRLSSGLIYNQKNNSLAWPYETELLAGDQNFGGSVFQHRVTLVNQEFKGVLAEVNYGLRVQNNLHVMLSAGMHKLETISSNNSNFEKSKFRPMLVLEYKPTDYLFTSLGFKKDFEYQALTLNLTTPEVIEVDTTSFNLLYYTDAVRIPSRVTYRKFTDGNQRLDADLEAKLPVDQSKNWIWLGVGASYVSTTTVAAYWSPSQFQSIGPRFEFNVAVFQPDLHFFGEIDYNYIKEDVHHNQGYSMRIGFDKGNRNAMQFKISGFVVDSTELGQGWKTQGISAELNF